MEEKTCGNCKHFRLHYIRRARKYSPLHYGHCVYPRCKKRKTEEPACQHWKPTENEDEIVSDS